MKLKPIFARSGISVRTCIVFNSILFFFTGLIIFTQLSVFTQPASAISFTTSTVRSADVLDYQALGYTYDTLSIQGSNKNLKARKNAANLTSSEILQVCECCHELEKNHDFRH